MSTLICRPTSRCRCSIRRTRSRSARWSGRTPSPRCAILQHYKQTLALRLIPEFAAEFKSGFGRDSGGLLRTYRAEDAELLVVAMGSVNGTIKDTIDEMRADGLAIGLVTLVSFRPFPTAALREAAGRARKTSS